MGIISLRERLALIDEPGKLGFKAWPSGYPSAPRSLAALCEATLDPVPEPWHNAWEQYLDTYWAQNCQGVTFAEGHWYFTSNGSSVAGPDPTTRGIYKVSGSVKDVHYVLVNDADHLGDLDHYQGRLYAALEQSPHSPYKSAVLDIGTDFTGRRILPLLSKKGGRPPQSTSMPWCAINPWNGLLYSSGFNNVDTIFAYEQREDGWYNVESANLDIDGKYQRVQGGCFSPNGHLYLSVDTYAEGKYKAVYVFSALNGDSRGRILVLAEESYQELEGLCFVTRKTGGHVTQLHVVLLEIRDFAKDNIYFKHYRAIDPDRV